MTFSTENLRRAPFNLDAAAIAWVEATRARLSPEATLRQLFNQASMNDELSAAQALASEHFGGVTRFAGGDLSAAWQATRALIEAAQIPLLISGDVEGGGIALGAATPVPNQLGLAATNDLALNTEMTSMMAQEAKAMGYNWTFGPVIDINARFRSAIVGTRSYGSDPQRIVQFARSHVASFQKNGLAATAKHWPGEGFDDRDQHLVTTLNPLNMEEWERSFGTLYRALIGDGLLCVMSAHIALPAWAQARGAQGLERYRPASMSKFLNQDLLRERLGFNGLIVSDATSMAGLTSWGERAEYFPQIIEHGCDMILFSRDFESDIGHLRRALASGTLSEARVEAAVTRVLGLKAALGLHTKTHDELLPPLPEVRARLRTPHNQSLAETAARASVTLVKDVRNTLPISLAKHRRIVLVTDSQRATFVSHHGASPDLFGSLLAARGFEVRAYSAEAPPTPSDCDLVLYLLAQESVLSVGTIFLNWRQLHGGPIAAMHRLWTHTPCILISLGHPYYLYDAPRMPCVSNAYCSIEAVQTAVVARLLGEAPFAGTSPVDAHCGLPDAAY